MSARGAGNVFVADSNHGVVREGRIGEIPVRVEWLSKDTLRIVYPPQARVFRAENPVSGIAVSYSEKSVGHRYAPLGAGRKLGSRSPQTRCGIARPQHFPVS
jgi:hypothetical protein